MSKFRGILKYSGIFSKLLLIIGFTCFFALLAVLVWTIITGGDATEIGSMKLLQLFQSIGLFILPPLVLAYLWNERPFAFLHLNKKLNWSNAGFIVLFMVVVIPFVNLLGDLNQQLVLPKVFAGLETWMKTSEAETAMLTEKMLDVHNAQGLLFNIFLIAMIPAFGEELFFRGAIQNVFREWKGAVVAVWITAFIFSAIHMQFYGFVPRLLLGAFFGYLLVWNGNLWLPIIAHFTNNVIAVIFYYLKNNGYQTVDIDKIGIGNTLWIGCISAVLAIVGVVFIKKRLQKTNFSDSASDK